MRGYGGSSAPTTSEAYALKEIVEDMVELHDHLGVPPAIWIGVSRHQLTHADKGANNDDTHVNGAITAKHRRAHSASLLGKHERGPAQSHL
jgi:pimeloyl-ACP methyl ester carboxylesterase